MWRRDDRKYKTNVRVLRTMLPGTDQNKGGGAYMSGDFESFGLFMESTPYMRVNPPSWLQPHEFGHELEMHQAGFNNNASMGF